MAHDDRPPEPLTRVNNDRSDLNYVFRLASYSLSGGNLEKAEPMSNHYHAVIWIDHLEARIFHFNVAEVDQLVLHPHNPTHHIHHKANSIGSGHAAEDHEFFEQVAHAIADAGAVLVTGPAKTKNELVKHIARPHVFQGGAPGAPAQSMILVAP
jgi:hypothetical protein